jgi:hypothetical protein
MEKSAGVMPGFWAASAATDWIDGMTYFPAWLRIAVNGRSRPWE